MTLHTHPSLQAFLDSLPAGDSRLVVFDCDGTVIKGDIGEAMFYRQIERFFFRRSPAELWPDAPGRERLAELYQELGRTDKADRARSPEFEEFAGLLRSRYVDQIAEGAIAKACADIVRLFAGFTPGEVRAFAADTFAEETAATVGERRLGGRRRPVGVRYIREAVELLATLLERGFDVWAVSGSNRWSVEPVFRPLGIPPERIIGIELGLENGVFLPAVAEPVPIREGKIGALRARTAEVPSLVASDSKNDIPLFLYASTLRVRINSRNRDTEEFFRTAGITPDESWVLLEHPTVEPEVEESWRTRL